MDLWIEMLENVGLLSCGFIIGCMVIAALVFSRKGGGEK